MSFSDTIDMIVSNVEQHWPDILSGISLTSGVAATIYGIAITPKVMDGFLQWVMENTTEEDRRGLKLSELRRLIPWKTQIKLAWKYYIPVVLGTATSIGAGIAADVLHDRKEAAYAALATAAEARLNDFVQSTKEVVGPKKYDEIEAATAQKTVDRLPEQRKDENVFYVNKRTEGFPVIDNFSMRVYFVDRDHLDKVQDKLNRKLLMEDVTVNDVYRALGDDIPLPAGGDNLLYSITNGELTFVTDMRPGFYEGRPAGILDLVHNLCIRHNRDLIKIDKYA